MRQAEKKVEWKGRRGNPWCSSIITNPLVASECSLRISCVERERERGCEARLLVGGALVEKAGVLYILRIGEWVGLYSTMGYMAFVL
jgi:hypothetical protein